MDINVFNAIVEDPLFAQSDPCATLGKKPLGFIDAGARGGVHDIVAPLGSLTAVLGFEPDAEECRRLTASMSADSPWARFAIEPMALAAGEGEAPVYVLARESNSSLRPPNQAFIDRYKIDLFEQKSKITMQTTSLDKVLFERYAADDYWGEFIKLDTQGTEFEILQGAERVLSERTVAIMTEVEFFELYQGQKLFSEVELFLRERGFSFYGFFEMHFRSRKLLDKRNAAGRERSFFADAVFFKDPLPGGGKGGSLSPRGNHVLFCCAVLLGYYDFALQLALETWATGDEAGRIESFVRQRAAQRASSAYQDAIALAEYVRAHPREAVVAVGRFVDRRRHLADYDDVR